jgi:hypothetical protein
MPGAKQHQDASNEADLEPPQTRAAQETWPAFRMVV